MAFYAKALLAMMHINGIVAAEITFGKAEIMNGIQQVGFAYAIAAANAYNTGRKNMVLLYIIFKLDN